MCVTDLGAAVAMVSGAGSIQGVVRFLQLSEDHCLIDGTIDGLEPGPHGLHVHTLGDLTQDCLRWALLLWEQFLLMADVSDVAFLRLMVNSSGVEQVEDWLVETRTNPEGGRRFMA